MIDDSGDRSFFLVSVLFPELCHGFENFKGACETRFFGLLHKRSTDLMGYEWRWNLTRCIHQMRSWWWVFRRIRCSVKPRPKAFQNPYSQRLEPSHAVPGLMREACGMDGSGRKWSYQIDPFNPYSPISIHYYFFTDRDPAPTQAQSIFRISMPGDWSPTMQSQA